MKKRYIAVILSFIIVLSTVVPVYATDNDLNYLLVSTWSYDNIITYDALSALAAQVAHDIGTDQCPLALRGGSVHMAYNGSYWYIIVWNNDRTQSLYVGSGTSRVYVSLPAQHTQVLWNIEGLIDTIDNNVNSIKSYCTSMSNNITQIVNGLNYMIRNWGNTYFCSYSQANQNPYPVKHVTKTTGDIMVAQINDHIGEKINYIAESGIISTYFIVGAGYNQNNYLMVEIEDTDQINSYTVYLCDSRRNMFVADMGVDNNNYTPFDPSSIIAAIANIGNKIDSLGNKIDRIYDWLDNADLSTNQTIITIVNNTQNDVNNANGLYNLVQSLFKTAYGDLDDNTTVSDWTSAGNYFANLWSDPEP